MSHILKYGIRESSRATRREDLEAGLELKSKQSIGLKVLPVGRAGKALRLRPSAWVWLALAAISAVFWLCLALLVGPGLRVPG
jgi:hypothetical protein